MTWDGSGDYVATDGINSTPGLYAAQATDGDAVIKSADLDLVLEDLVGGIKACLAKNGENAMTADMAAGGFNINNMADGAAAGENATWDKLIKSAALSTYDFIITLNLADKSHTVVAGNSRGDVAAALAGLLDAVSGFTASAEGSVVVITRIDGASFTVDYRVEPAYRL